MTSCENVDCLMTASNLRRLRENYLSTSRLLSEEIDKRQRYEREIKELNKEIENLEKRVRAANEKYN
jgi:septal ring factor EnvC (AmiA/AmiB activator)